MQIHSAQTTFFWALLLFIWISLIASKLDYGLRMLLEDTIHFVNEFLTEDLERTRNGVHEFVEFGDAIPTDVAFTPDGSFG
ncbi:hypothetical protein D3C81_2217650 [compost metagenome]